MTLDRNAVQRIAELAEIAVTEEELPTLVAQLDRIVDYVAQLEGYQGEDDLPAFLPGPSQTPLRPDVVNPVPLTRGPATFAPAWRQGYFVVPRVAGMDDPA